MSSDKKRKRKGVVGFVDIQVSASQSEDGFDELSVSLLSSVLISRTPTWLYTSKLNLTHCSSPNQDESESSEESSETDDYDEQIASLTNRSSLRDREYDEAEHHSLLEDLFGEALAPVNSANDSQQIRSALTDLPVRLLDNFAILDAKTKDMISPEDVNSQAVLFDPTAYGLASPLYDEEDDAESEIYDDDLSDVNDSVQPVQVQLSSILRVHTDHTAKIYLHTVYAWYQLDRPSRAYRRLYERTWIRQRLVALICDIIRVSKTISRRVRKITSMAQFVNFLKSEKEGAGGSLSELAFEADRIIGRRLSEQDLIDHVSPSPLI